MSANTKATSVESISSSDLKVEEAPLCEFVEEYPVISSIRTQVVKYGRIRDNETHIAVMIPGTPGAVDFTKEFMQTVHEESGLPVWGLSYAGQSVVPKHVPWVEPEDSVFTLQGQIDHKLDFLFNYVPSHLKVILMGHSFGCYAILEMLRKIPRDRVAKAILLFPAIERMLETDRGQGVLNSLQSRKRHVALCVARVLSWAPRNWRIAAFEYLRGRNAQMDISANFRNATVDFVDPWCLRNVFRLVEEELSTVKELDREHVREHLDSLIFYYGADDWWAPRKYYEDLKATFPEKEEIYLCEEGFRHAFVVDASVPMGKKVAGWIMNIVGKRSRKDL